MLEDVETAINKLDKQKFTGTNNKIRVQRSKTRDPLKQRNNRDQQQEPKKEEDDKPSIDLRTIIIRNLAFQVCYP